MNKIEKAYKIIKSRLPKTYFIPDIKIYKTVYSMLKAVAKEENRTYKQQKNRYNRYLKRTVTGKYNYITSKYDTSPGVKRKTKENCLSIQAIASDHIKINFQNTTNFNLQAWVFLLLHELGHYYYNSTKHRFNEKITDKFAIRWVRKLIKEGLIK